MKSKIHFVFLYFLIVGNIVLFGQALNGDYYIPQGSNLQGFTSLGSAISSLNANGCIGTVNFIIDDNLQENGSALYISRNDLTSLNKLIIKPAINKQPIITIINCEGNVATNQYAGFTITSKYITIDGSNNGGSSRDLLFKLNDATNGKYVIFIYDNADNITIKNTKVEIQTGLGNESCGIYVKGSSTNASDNLLIDNCEIGNWDSRISPYYGISLFAETGIGLKLPTIQNSQIIGRSKGIYFTRALDENSTFNISGNTIAVNEGNDIACGIDLVTSAVAGTINITNNRINYIKSNSANLAAAIFMGTPWAPTVNVLNNFIGGDFNATPSTTGVYGINWNSMNNQAYIYHNTIVINSGNNSTTGESACIMVKNFATIKNNILINNIEAGYCFVNNPNVSDYNNLYITAGNIGKIGTTNYKLLSDWQTGNPNDVHSISKSVSFAGGTDFHLTYFSQGDFDLAGTNITTVTTDIDGNLRSSNYPYMGADENSNVQLYPYKRNINGESNDWLGIASETLHATVVSEEEAIYTGKINDCRTDQHIGGFQAEHNNDITEVRITRDNSYLYFLFRMQNIFDINKPYIAVTIDKDRTDSFPVWIGDESPVTLNPGTNRGWERQLAIHATSENNLNIELYADDGDRWYGPLSNYSVVGNTVNKLIEARIALYDLNISPSDEITFTIATFDNKRNNSGNVVYNNTGDATYLSYIDAITPGYSKDENAYYRVGGDYKALEHNENLNNNVNWQQSLTPLPVELISFNAYYTKNIITLNWQTATEINSYCFEIERSNDNTNWVKVGSVNAGGNSNKVLNYEYFDNISTEGKYYYRLKQIDIDGSFKYTSIVEVNAVMPMLYSLSQNYPNPFNPVTKISYSIPVNAKVMLNIYSITGELVTTLVDEDLTAGNYTIDFDASSLASGTYFYRIIANDFVQTKKMLLIK